MNIKDLIVSDGEIEKYSLSGNSIEIFFCDYCNNHFVFIFKNILSLVESGSVGFDLSDMKVTTVNGNNIEVSFYENTDIVLKIIAEEVDVLELSLYHDKILESIRQAIKSFPVEEKPPKNHKAIRKKHPRAYEKWDSDNRDIGDSEDDLLKQAYGLTQEIDQLVEIFQRNKGAIESRLLKLGVITKDDLDYYKKN